MQGRPMLWRTLREKLGPTIPGCAGQIAAHHALGGGVAQVSREILDHQQ